MKKILIISLSFILTACSGLSDEFSCNKTAESSCITVSEANAKANNQNMNKTTSVNNVKENVLPPQKITEKTYTISGVENIGEFFNQDTIASQNLNEPSRTKEKINRIWMASYIDDKDNFHREQIIYFSTLNPQWERD